MANKLLLFEICINDCVVKYATFQQGDCFHECLTQFTPTYLQLFPDLSLPGDTAVRHAVAAILVAQYL